MKLCDVLERFAMMAGLSGEEAAKYGVLCEDAMEQTTRRAADTDAEADKPLCAAAAALALYRWALVRAAAEPQEFAAGDVKIDLGGVSPEAAKKVWEQAEAAAAPYLRDDDFLFRRILP
ncbi:MAG: hypothetical protein GX424_01860 [Clostridiales bacterium]|nr:hypothetical protein [Clostridiales bacterium]